MNKSTSRQVAVGDIERLGPLGVILIRLMMSISDLTLASQALGVWNEEDRPAREELKGTARRYFVRLQIAHLYEALKIIDDIKNKHLNDVERCDRLTRASFTRVAEFLENEQYESIAGSVRNNVVFHYGHSGKLIARALKAIANKNPAKKVWVTTGRDLHHYNYEPATWVIDHIMLRQIFRLTTDTDLSDAADEVIERLFRIQTDFSDFAVHFIEHYTKKI
jgi:hypothetical protein